MKTKLPYLLCLFSLLFVNYITAQNTYVPDDGFEQYLIDVGIDLDPILDDYVPTANITSITDLYLGGYGITNLTGLEDFSGLTTLDVGSSASINSLDVSNNTVLKSLYVFNTSISSLDVSSNTLLETLNASNTSISSLDVSNNTLLETLNASNTSLSNLDISNNTALVNLDITNTSNLDCITVNDLVLANTNTNNGDWYIDQTSFYSLDCNNIPYTHVPDDIFEQYLINQNLDSGPLDDYVRTEAIQFVTNVSIYGLAITDLTGIEDFTALTTLDISSSSLSSLDVSNNLALTTLELYDSTISSLDVSANTALTNLGAYNTVNLFCITVADAFSASSGSGIYSSWSKDVDCNYTEDCSIPYTYIPDYSFEEYLIDQNYDSAPIDGFVPTANIETVTELNLSNSGVSDLTGLDDFTALTTLNLDNTNINSLDISSNTALTALNIENISISSLDVSNNTALTTLNINGTNLSSLDISANTALTTLNINGTYLLSSIDLSNNTLLTNFSAYNAALNSLDVSNNTALIELDINTTSISNLDVSNNTFLTTLNVYDTSLSNLDLRNNTLLTTLNADEISTLDCISVLDSEVANAGTGIYTNWQKDDSCSYSVDCLALTYVPDDGFEQYLISNNYDSAPLDDYVLTYKIEDLTEVYLYNSSVINLTGIEDFTALTHLEAYSSTLSSLDVSSNTLLTYLSVSSTPLSSIDVSSNTALTHLEVQQTSISSLDVTSNISLTYLDVQDLSLSHLDLSMNTALTEFYAFNMSNLDCINVADETAATSGTGNYSGWYEDGTVSYSEDCNPVALTHVPDDVFEQYLIDNNLDDVLDDYVPTANIETVTAVDLSNTNISNLTGIEDFTALFNLNISNTSLSSIDVSSNTALYVLNAFESSLSSLDVSNNLALYNLNIENTSISSLDLSSNIALYYLNVSFSSLSSLDVSNNTALSSLGIGNTSISNIDVSNNASLSTLTVEFSALSSLDVSNNSALTFLYAIITSNLDCIKVADATAANAGTGIYASWQKDATCSYSEDCNPVALTYVPDNVFEQYLIDNNLDDVLDDYVPTANIETVTFVNLGNTGVSDLTGIEDFAALTILSASDNSSLSSLDVSSNTALTALYTYETSLTSLDVSNNTLLTDLRVSNSPLTSLDVSNNTLLTTLNAFGTSISSIDLSLNTALTFLSINNTSSLSSLDVSTNIALTTLYVSNTPLSSLDLSTNTALTNLEANYTSNLDCITVADATAADATTGIYTNWTKDGTCSYSEDCNPVALTYVPDNVFEQYLIDNELDDVLDDYVVTANIETVTLVELYNTSVSNLTGIEDFTALTELNVFNTPLSSLDVSNNTALEVLYAFGTSISSLDVSSNTALIHLDIRNTAISNIDVSMNTLLTGLNITDTSISSIDVSSNTQLISLRMGSTPLSSIDISGNTELIVLVISNTQISTLDVGTNTSLVGLYVDNTSISSLDVSNNTELIYFNATNTPNLDCITVADATAADATTGIYTNWTKDGTCSYSEDCNPVALTYVPDNVFEQYLIDNNLDDVLDDYVVTDDIATVTTVNVGNRNISDLTGIEDFAALTTLYAFGTSISSLDVSNNLALDNLQIHYTSISSLDVSNNISLTRLIVGGTPISSLDVSNNVILDGLSIQGSSITSLDVSNNTMLTFLDVNDTSISSLDLSNQASLTLFRSLNTSNLDCITVADAAAANAGTGIYSGWTKDTSCSYSEDCNPVALTYVPDNVFEQYLIDNNLDDVLDDYVVTANIETVTTVDLANTSVSDLTGIKDFTALTTLYAYNTSLSTIDISSNTALTILIVGDNSLLTSLDVTNNTALTHLSVRETSLSSLNISNNVSLTDLRINDTSISSLDLSANPLLTILSAFRTSLSSLDVSYNTLLTYLAVDQTSLSSLDVSNHNSLTYLSTNFTSNLDCIAVANEFAANAGTGIYSGWTKDASCSYSEHCSPIGYTYVPDDQFELYLIDRGWDDVLDNYVLTANIETQPAINLIAFPGVVDLTGIEDFTALTQLFANNSSVATVDLSANLALTTIYLGNTSISSLDVSANTALNNLNVGGSSLTNLELGSAPITILNASQTPLSSLDISGSTSLINVNLNNTSISSLILTTNTSLTQLNLVNTPISSLDVRSNTALTNLFTQNTNNLFCINVADEVAAIAGNGIYSNWTKDSTCSYSENCGLVSTGNLIISEVMQNPNIVSDINGEYFEVYNPEAFPVNLNGWTISDGNSDLHTITGDVIVDADSFIVLGNNSNTVTNGGVTLDYQYANIDLDNGADALILTDGNTTEIDRVEYDGGTIWPNPDGAAMIYVGSNIENNNDGSLWEAATTSESITTDFGSPGSNGEDQIVDWLVYVNSSWNRPPTIETDLKNALIKASEVYSFTSSVDLLSLVVKEDADVTINAAVTLKVPNVILESTSTGYASLISNGTITGLVNYKRHVNAVQSIGGNDLVTPPVSGQVFTDFVAQNDNIVSNTANTLFLFGPFDKTIGDYVTYSNTETAELVSGIGYRAGTTDNGILHFQGTINQGSVSQSVSNSGPFYSKWNLIGNPYPSYMNVQDFLSNTNNLTTLDANNAGIYGYDGDASDGWVIYNLNTIDYTTALAPGQGFFVAVENTGTVEFNSNIRQHGTTDDFIAGRSSNTNQHLRLELNNGNKTYKTDFYFNDNSSDGLDLGYDAGMFGNSAGSFAIYSHLVEDNTGLDMAIQSLAKDFLSEGIVPLGINANEGEQLTIAIETSSLPQTVEVYLEDTVENTFTLLNTSNYVITPSSTLEGTGRFYLHFSNTTLSNLENELDKLKIYTSKATKELIVSGQLYEDAKAKLYDVNGREILSVVLDSSIHNNAIDIKHIQFGVYILQISNSSHNYNQKVIIN
ncbi:lamin tail domain-containing protein [Winogradskyella helgolandensis]|uniref:lamin tail domain-containing protein n=1 Tax=Winogradskyella helgolandensis TaxID=2697010 RepID=UPI0015C882C2|nr:lamin tail domain-containing protein [Winogradskyella helgolandensis]